MRKILITLSLTFCALAFSSALLYAPPSDPGGGGGPPCLPPPCIPIDGGIGLLMAAGVGLGAKKVYESSRSLG